MDIITLLARPEGKTVEYKRDLSSHRPVLKTAVAFSNTAGGQIVFGVEDDGSVVGVHDPLAFEERLASVIADGIEPRIVPDIEMVSLRGHTLVVATVYPGPSRPYHVRAEGADDGVYVRIGSTNRRTDEPLRAELARNASGASFDETPLPQLDSEEVDFRAASESFAGVRKLERRDMLSLGMLAADGSRRVPTVGGVLLFGARRRERFPDAWVQAGRFKGLTRTHIIDTTDIDVALPDTVEAVMAFVKRHTAMHVSIEGARREEWWEYPLVAVREAVTNALVHADYSQQGAPLRVAIYDDRIEIENPGMLLPGMTFDDVYGGVSRLRNRVIGRAFRELRLVEQWGSGVGRMVMSCRAAGLRDPLIEELGTTFRVTLFGEQATKPDVDPVSGRITGALLGSPQGLSTAEIARAIDRTPRAARTRLKSMVEQGLIAEVATGPNDPLKRYIIAEERAGYAELDRGERLGRHPDSWSQP